MVSTNEDHAWCLKYDGLDMMSLLIHGKRINPFDECKPLIHMLMTILVSRSYALLQVILISIKNIRKDFQFFIVDYI